MKADAKVQRNKRKNKEKGDFLCFFAKEDKEIDYQNLGATHIYSKQHHPVGIYTLPTG